MPWEKQPDADVRTGFFARFLATQLAKLLIALPVVIFGIAVSFAAKRAWLLSLTWTAIAAAVAYGCYLSWRKLRVRR